MIPIIDGLLGVIGGVITHLNIQAARKYIDEVYSLKKDIVEEEAKGVDEIDDGKLEQLYSELKLAVEAMQAAIIQGIPKS